MGNNENREQRPDDKRQAGQPDEGNQKLQADKRMNDDQKQSDRRSQEGSGGQEQRKPNLTNEDEE
ncbi:MAG: hypothetical protein SGI74_04765 [Oligoflexia bacterium]|nr:hypothetical protein [Oligoflexia bacterium]